MIDALGTPLKGWLNELIHQEQSSRSERGRSNSIDERGRDNLR